MSLTSLSKEGGIYVASGRVKYENLLEMPVSRSCSASLKLKSSGFELMRFCFVEQFLGETNETCINY